MEKTNPNDITPAAPAATHEASGSGPIGGPLRQVVQTTATESITNTLPWQEIFDAINDAICVLDPHHRIIKCNQAMCRLLKTTESRIVRRLCWEAIHGSDRMLADCPCRRSAATRRRESLSLKFDQRWFEVSVVPSFDEEGQLKGYVHVMSDVSHLANEELTLRETRQTLLTVLDSIDAIIYATDLETHVPIFMNRHMRDIVTDDLNDQPCWKAFYDRDEPCAHCRDLQLLDAQGNPTDLHVCEAMNDEGTRWFLHHDRAIKWVNGRWVRLHVATDISAVKFLEQERRQTEARLRQAQKMEAIGVLAGGIAHDFNNILSAILGFSELALDDANRGQSNPAFIGQVLRAGERARELVQQILTFSRQTESEAKPIQVQPILKEALKLLRASLPSTIEIESAIQCDAVIQADPIQVHQVIMNLCTNASHAMRQCGGRLKVSLREETLSGEEAQQYPGLQTGRYLKMVVADTGHGIDPKNLEKIFDPYFTTKEKGEGTGMGLAVVQGIVHTCGGSVGVASTPGKGTIFTVYLPIIQQTSPAHMPHEYLVPFGREHILFVDDEAPLAELSKEMLERLGYRMTVNTSSAKALYLFEQQPDAYDLVITDMTMPGMTGDVLAERILALRPDIPVIICTGYSEKVTQEMIDRLGIRALIRKPLVRSDLGSAVRQVLDRDRPAPII